MENSIFQVPDAAKGPQDPKFTKNPNQKIQKNPKPNIKKLILNLFIGLVIIIVDSK